MRDESTFKDAGTSSHRQEGAVGGNNGPLRLAESAVRDAGRSCDRKKEASAGIMDRVGREETPGGLPKDRSRSTKDPCCLAEHRFAPMKDPSRLAEDRLRKPEGSLWSMMDRFSGRKDPLLPTE